MSFQIKEPILVIGLGGVGSKLAIKAKETLNSDCLLISNDTKDFSSDNSFIQISTDSNLRRFLYKHRNSEDNFLQS